jgi:hypothetical protein
MKLLTLSLAAGLLFSLNAPLAHADNLLNVFVAKICSHYPNAAPAWAKSRRNLARRSKNNRQSAVVHAVRRPSRVGIMQIFRCILKIPTSLMPW